MPSRAVCPLVVVLLLVWSLMASPIVVAGTSMMELPLEHWSYDAVRILADTPLLRGDELNFHANSTITRYEMALLVNRVLTRLENLGEADETLTRDLSPDEVLDQLFDKAKNAPGINGSLTNQHLEIIRRLVDGFENELSTLGLAERFLPSPNSSELIWQSSSFASDLIDYSSSLEFNLKDREPLLVSDRTIQLSDKMEIGATVFTQMGSDLIEETSVGTIGGRLTVSPNFNLTGGIATNSSQDEIEAEALHVGADVQLGDVQLGAKYRTVKPGFDSLAADSLTEDVGTTGYDFTVRVGNILVRSSKDTIDSLTKELGSIQEVRSVGVTYDLGNNTLVRADYGYTDLPADDLTPTNPSDGDEGKSVLNPMKRRTAIGVGVETPKGALELGLQYEGNRELGISKLGTRGASAGVKYPVPWAEETVLQADVAVEEGDDKSKTTSLSLGFVLQDNASVLVGYKMIDFSESMSDEEETEFGSSSNMATAEFSIRF